jgi:cytochrome b6-f complex iron-sulfur subunit
MTCPDLRRRTFLKLAGGAALAGAALAATGCGGGGDEATAVALEVPLAELPDGVRVYRELGDVPVEILRRGDAVTARSMLCTHQGCEIRWEQDANRYFCPCHDGVFAPDGTVIAGPPTRPLSEYPVRLTAERVIIGP